MKNQVILPLTHPVPAPLLTTADQRNLHRVERTLSLLAGGWLLYKSLKKMANFPVAGLQGIATSGFLFYRGATGEWPTYRGLNRLAGIPAAKAPTVILKVGS